MAGIVEGGEPMMTILRCSDFPVMLILEVLERIGLRYARVVAAIFGLTGRELYGRHDNGKWQ